MKAGFLNSNKTKASINKKSLYESDDGKIGSGEGRPEHPWNKIMGKSKVIDMNDMTPAQQKEYNRRNAGGENGQEVLKEIYERPKGAVSEPQIKEEDFGDIEFEELMNSSEPLYGAESDRRQRATRENNEEMAGWADALSQPTAWEKEASAMKKAKEKKAKEEAAAAKSKEVLRKGTTDYSKFEEIDEDCVEKEEERQEKIQRIRAMKMKEMQEAKKTEDLRAEREGDHLVAEIAARKAAKKKTKKKSSDKTAAAPASGTEKQLLQQVEDQFASLGLSSTGNLQSDAEEALAQVKKNREKEAKDAQAAFLATQQNKAADAEKDYWAHKLETMKNDGGAQPEEEGEEEDSGVQAAKEQARNCARAEAAAAAEKEEATYKAKQAEEEEIIEVSADGTFDVSDEAVEARRAKKERQEKASPGFNLKGAFDSKPKPKAKAPGPVTTVGDPTVKYKVKQEDKTVKVAISLPGVEGMGAVDLSISSRQVLLKAAGFQPLKIELPVEVNEDKVKAKFSKTKCELTVKIPAA